MAQPARWGGFLGILLLSACGSSAPPQAPAGKSSGLCETGAIEPMQPLTVDTGPVKAASCTLKNDKGAWLLESTPGPVSVSRSAAPLTVTCNKPGYLEGVEKVESTSQDRSMAKLVSREFLSVSEPSAALAYDYPGLITVHLTTIEAPKPQ